MIDALEQRETLVQRMQRRQAEKLAALEGATPIGIPAADAPAPRPATPATPSVERPDAAMILRLDTERRSAVSGKDLQVAAATISTLVTPFADYLEDQGKTLPYPHSEVACFWASCLRAGMFPHLPPKPDRELNQFEQWVYSTAPTLAPDGTINNWRTL
jgi:hypothetical protein